MNKQLVLLFSVSLGIALVSCNKNMTALDKNLFKTNPNPLETKAGKVDATVTGTFPTKYFSKKATVTVTPVLKFNGQEVKGAPEVFQGEKVVGNNKTISYKTGGTYTMKPSFAYTPEMSQSELYLQFNVVQKKKIYQIPEVKVADGTIATSELASTNASELAPALIPDKFQRVIQQKQEADIMFLIQQSNLRKSETKSTDIVDLTNKIKSLKDAQNETVSSFDIVGNASPDGGMSLNTNLAEKRTKVTNDYIKKQLKKLKSNISPNTKFTAEDWDGFQKLMEESNIQDKQLILRVLSMYSDPEQREREIKNISVAFKTIAQEILPKLRRSRLMLTVDVTGKSDSEISNLAQNDPSKLSVDELLFAATLTNNNDEKAAIYTKATELFPQDIRGFNNLAAVQFEQGKVSAAEANAAKALAIDSKSENANFNAGLIALSKKDLSKAEEYFGKSGGTTGNIAQAQGTLSTISGDYAKAEKAYGTTASNNAALTQILTSNYTGAREVLSEVAKPNALTSYLGAIVGARTNDRETVYSNLRNAVKQDSSYASKALKDVEFANFFTDTTFLSIVK